VTDNHPLSAREAIARANIEQDLRLLGFDWTVDVRRLIGGYTLFLSKGPRIFVQRGIGEAVLEAEWSSARDRIFQAARLELEGLPEVGSAP
jgi:hypothetical protein